MIDQVTFLLHTYSRVMYKLQRKCLKFFFFLYKSSPWLYWHEILNIILIFLNCFWNFLKSCKVFLMQYNNNSSINYYCYDNYYLFCKLKFILINCLHWVNGIEFWNFRNVMQFYTIPVPVSINLRYSRWTVCNRMLRLVIDCYILS